MSKDSILHNVELNTDKEVNDFLDALIKAEEERNEQIDKAIIKSLSSMEIRKVRDEKLIRKFINMLIAEMYDREYMGVKYKQGTFSDDNLYQLENKFFEEEDYDK